MAADRVVVVGGVNLDHRIEVARMPAPGQTVLAIRSGSGAGGKGANQAVAAASIPGGVSLVAAVGDDSSGVALLSDLAAAGVDTRAVRRVVGCPTGTATVVVDATGSNMILVEPGANYRLAVADLPLEVIASARVVLLQMEIDVAVSVAAAEAATGLVIINPAPISVGVASLFPVANVLVPNEHELAELTGRLLTSEDDVAAAAASIESPGDVLVTLGARGALLWERRHDRVSVFRPPVVRVVDTTGAGDYFCGVLAAALAGGSELSQACRRAVELAAWSTTFIGARVPRPTVA